MRQFFLLIALLFSVAAASAKPRVWIISDGLDSTLTTAEGRRMSDPDDISAMASYLLLSNHFETLGIVVASGNHPEELRTAPNQADWAEKFFGGAYALDLPRLNEEIGGYQSEIPYLESSIKATGEKYDFRRSYSSLKPYPSIEALYKALRSSDERLNVLCWGTLTEAAILVNHCKDKGDEASLKKLRFISHWTNSSINVGTATHPERVHNCFNDAQACDYIKDQALNGTIEFYELGSIGQAGLVEGAPRGEEYYTQFRGSHLGTIFIEGKYITKGGYVDSSDAATHWLLLGSWGISLEDVASNGRNDAATELRNIDYMSAASKAMHDELLRRSRVVSGATSSPISIENLFPQHGLTDGHVWEHEGRLYLVGGHDESPLTTDTWRMDRWEMWSTADLRRWRHERSLHPKDTYIGDEPNCWAGDITSRDGKFYWYFSNRNTDTGVMVADSTISGTYHEPLGRPLLPKDIIPGHPYDPEIVVDGDKYYILFSAGNYQIAELGDDMISLKSAPQPLVVNGADCKPMWTADKSSYFKRGDTHYLVWGSKYATSDELLGPYTFRGDFLSGGHTSIFNWDGQWYVIQENKDISLFCRGLSLKPIFFNLDGTIQIPPEDYDYPGESRSYNFEANASGWRPLSGTSLEWRSRCIEGELSGNGSIVSATWLLTPTESLRQLKVRIKNSAGAEQAKIYIATYTPVAKGKFWADASIDWSEAFSATIELEAEGNKFVEYIVDIDGKLDGSFLKALRIDPAVGVDSGRWAISNITIE